VAPTLLAPAGTPEAGTSSAEFPAGGGGEGLPRWWGYGVREVLWKHSSLKRVRGCGRDIVSSDGLVRVVRVGNGAATRVWGVATCGSPWVCPVCLLGWSKKRAGELQHAQAMHLASGGGLEFFTVTVEHGSDDPLEVVWSRLHDQWSAMVEQRWWKEARARSGVVGVVRTVEVTWSPTAGWHPHAHCLVFTERPWSEPVRAAIFKRIGEWFKRRREVEPEAPGRVGQLPPAERGSGPFEPADGGPVRDPDKVAKYMTYMASKHATPQEGASASLFGLVEEYGRSGKRQALALWHEYEQASKGKHPIRWSPGLRERFGITGRSDRDPLPADHLVVRTLGKAEWRDIVREDRVGILRAAARASVHSSELGVH
jgi:hypothetical protein